MLDKANQTPLINWQHIVRGSVRTEWSPWSWFQSGVSALWRCCLLEGVYWRSEVREEWKTDWGTRNFVAPSMAWHNTVCLSDEWGSSTLFQTVSNVMPWPCHPQMGLTWFLQSRQTQLLWISNPTSPRLLLISPISLFVRYQDNIFAFQTSCSAVCIKISLSSWLSESSLWQKALSMKVHVLQKFTNPFLQYP